MKKKRILLVDDHADILEMLTLVLSERFVVSSCSSAEAAFRVLERAKPDVLVLDVVMSPVDGVQCLEAIRARTGYADVPAVALTALAREVEKSEMLASGFQAVVVKPMFDERELIDTIESLLLSSAPRDARERLLGNTSAA